MDKHLEKECPHRNPRGPLSPLGNPKYHQICKKHGHVTDKSFLIPSVTIAQGWPNPILTCYPQVFALHTPPPSQAQKRDYGARLVVQVLAPTLVLLPHKPIYQHNYHPPNVGRYSNQPHHPKRKCLLRTSFPRYPNRSNDEKNWKPQSFHPSPSTSQRPQNHMVVRVNPIGSLPLFGKFPSHLTNYHNHMTLRVS